MVLFIVPSIDWVSNTFQDEPQLGAGLPADTNWPVVGHGPVIADDR